VVFPVFFLAQFLANQFGFDRDGFRALILSPADRRLILLGKNLAALPVGVVFGTLLIMLTTARLRLPPLTVLATLFQLASVLLMTGIAGNLLSMLVPYRIQPGSMKPTKMPGLAMLVLMSARCFFPWPCRRCSPARYWNFSGAARTSRLCAGQFIFRPALRADGVVYWRLPRRSAACSSAAKQTISRVITGRVE